MADKKKNNSMVKKSSTKKPKPAKPRKKKSPINEMPDVKEVNIEDTYPDVTKQIRQFVEDELPSCPRCGSDNTARVQVGIIGRAITIAASTRKVRLVPNVEDRLGTYFCNACKKFFN